MARFSGAWGPAQRLKCWSEDGNPASHGTVQLRLRKPSNAPQGQLETRTHGFENQEISESGGIQAPGACGPGLQGAWGPGPQGLGPGPPGGWGLFPTKTKNHPNKGVGVGFGGGTWRETKPGYPPYPPPPNPPPRFGAVREKGRGFGTRPARSADNPKTAQKAIILHTLGVQVNPKP